MICWYWILKLKARFLSGDYAEALAAADKAKALLWASAAQIQLLDYFYYTALTVAAFYENATADEQNRWRELLTAHREQLREWAENYPPTFGDKHALVSAEIARLEGRDADAMRLYEQAIRSARENGFVQNEGMAHEVAARFYAARGFETIAHAYLRNARYCYLRWGADGKVRQLDRLYPHLAAAEGHRPTATIGSPVQQLDVASVVKASQAVSSEILLAQAHRALMTIALENAGADRGLLILPAGRRLSDSGRGQTDRRSGRGRAAPERRSPAQLPESLLRYVIRTHESVIIDDASGPICSRRTIICAAHNQIDPLPPADQTRAVDGPALPREHVDLARVHAGSDRGPGAAGGASGDLAGEHPSLRRSCRSVRRRSDAWSTPTSSESTSGIFEGRDHRGERRFSPTWWDTAATISSRAACAGRS